MPAAVVRGTRRHALAYRFAWALALLPVTLLFRFRREGRSRLPSPCLVISNHVTEVDFLFVGLSFAWPMYFVVSEALFRSPLLAGLLGFFFAPILKRKGSADRETAVDLVRRLRAGYSVCLFVEGNTCFDGRTGDIPPSIAALIKASGAGLVTYRIEGGYLSLPRWGRTLRRGRVRGIVAGEYGPDRLSRMAPEEIHAAIVRDLYTDAATEQKRQPRAFRGRGKAEGLEHALYLCPRCLKIGSLRGRGSRFFCGCGLSVRYDAFGALRGAPISGVRDWILWQREELRRRFSDPGGAPALRDEGVTMYRLSPDHRRETLAAGTLRMDAQTLAVGERVLSLAEIPGIAIFRKNTLQFADGEGRQYELSLPRGASALKYRDLFEILRKTGG